MPHELHPARPARLRRLGYRIFYLLPAAVRRRLVRLVMAKYIVGAVALVRDAEATAPGRLLLLRQPPGRRLVAAGRAAAPRRAPDRRLRPRAGRGDRRRS